MSQFETLHEIIRQARRNLNQNNWDYLVGGVETETTLRRNRMALDCVAFRARVLRDVSTVDVTGPLLGRKLRLPVVLAPIGSLEMFEEGGGATVVKAAGEFGCAHMLSSVCDPGLEEVSAASPEAARIFQLYVRGGDDFIADYVRRATDSGYYAFCLTVDTAHFSRRERDIAKRYVTRGRRRAGGREFQAALSWAHVERVKKYCKVPLILKGIATAEDARIAVEHGVECVYVSNHGGRQLDHGRGSLDVLPEVVDAVAGKAEIMVDGGFCRGTDIVKAIAMGAKAVGLGRMQGYAVAAAGQAGVVRMLELLEDEVTRCLGLLGVTSLKALDGSYLHPAAPANPAHVLSAFPLLHISEETY
ncbi:MAG: alpha-hydroxy-acid oxidizing protein [Alphaproteobacteria bacterium]|nr:alpha-hydroxy-acid oxidizing protein [Alphaproteobacteria bacterium]